MTLKLCAARCQTTSFIRPIVIITIKTQTTQTSTTYQHRAAPPKTETALPARSAPTISNRIMVAAAAAEAAFGKLSQPQQDHEQQIAAAEAALQRGDVESARSLAQALSTAATGKGADEQQAPTPTMEQQGRALAVIIQADFHYSNTLTDLPQLLEDSATPLHELPLHVVLLWCVRRAAC